MGELKILHKLESLKLEGNNLAKIPNYKNIIITLLPNLKKLDGYVNYSFQQSNINNLFIFRKSP